MEIQSSDTALRPAGFLVAAGNSLSSLVGVSGNRVRTRSCWATMTAAVAFGIGSRRAFRLALWLS
jgi:CBS-domain-containing membrane protein